MSVSRFISLIVSGIYLIYVVVLCQGSSSVEILWSVLSMLMFIVFCLSCIWSSDELRDWTLCRTASTYPADPVALFGWVIFLLPAFRFIFTKMIHSHPISP